MQGTRFWNKQNMGDVWGRDPHHCRRKKDTVPENMLSFSLLGYVLKCVPDAPNAV